MVLPLLYNNRCESILGFTCWHAYDAFNIRPIKAGPGETVKLVGPPEAAGTALKWWWVITAWAENYEFTISGHYLPLAIKHRFL